VERSINEKGAISYRWAKSKLTTEMDVTSVENKVYDEAQGDGWQRYRTSLIGRSDLRTLHLARRFTLSRNSPVNAAAPRFPYCSLTDLDPPQSLYMFRNMAGRAPLVVPALKKHTATVIVAHGLGDSGAGW
jgi:hypothetical protein